MNCTLIRSNWELYHDSEGNSPLYREVNEHLARCPACRQWFDEQQGFEGGVTSRLREVSPSPELWTRIEKALPIGDSQESHPFLPLLRFLAVAASLLAIIATWQWVG